MGASNNIIFNLCDAVDQPSANMCANLCPAHLKSDSDYFVWKDTSERVAQRCDTLLLEGVEQPKNGQKPPEMLSPTRH